MNESDRGRVSCTMGKETVMRRKSRQASRQALFRQARLAGVRGATGIIGKGKLPTSAVIVLNRELV